MSIIIEVDLASSSLRMARIIQDLDAQAFSWGGVTHEAANGEGQRRRQGREPERDRDWDWEREQKEDILTVSSSIPQGLSPEPAQDEDDEFHCSDDHESEYECPYIFVHVAGVPHYDDDDLYAEWSMAPDPILLSTRSASRGWDPTDDEGYHHYQQ